MITKRNKVFVFMLLAVFNCISQKQFDYRKERHNFNKSLIDSSYIGKDTVFVINSNEQFESKYLGKIETNRGLKYHLISSSFLFDLKSSQKNESHIFIYNERNQYVGFYYLSLFQELPIKLYDNKLFFKRNECSNWVIVNFEKGIPRFINIKCNGENSYYEFRSE